MVLANSYLVKTRSSITSAFYADAAVATAIMYACYICAVYYMQMTFVRKARADPVALSIVEYRPGSAIFTVDILGYWLLAASTLLVALSLQGQNCNLLTTILYFHGVAGLTCFGVPFLPMIYEEQNENSDNFIWQTPLVSWCAIFLPICLLMADYFQSFAKG